MFKLVKRFFKDESGQGLAEYALILAGVAVVVMVVVWALGDQIKAIFTDVTDTLEKGPPDTP